MKSLLNPVVNILSQSEHFIEHKGDVFFLKGPSSPKSKVLWNVEQLPNFKQLVDLKRFISYLDEDNNLKYIETNVSKSLGKEETIVGKNNDSYIVLEDGKDLYSYDTGEVIYSFEEKHTVIPVQNSLTPIATFLSINLRQIIPLKNPEGKLKLLWTSEDFLDNREDTVDFNPDLLQVIPSSFSPMYGNSFVSLDKRNNKIAYLSPDGEMTIEKFSKDVINLSPTENKVFILTKDGEVFVVGHIADTYFSTTKVPNSEFLHKLDLSKHLKVEKIFPMKDKSLLLQSNNELYLLGSDRYLSNSRGLVLKKPTKVQLQNDIGKIEDVMLLHPNDNQVLILGDRGWEITNQDKMSKQSIQSLITTLLRVRPDRVKPWSMQLLRTLC